MGADRAARAAAARTAVAYHRAHLDVQEGSRAGGSLADVSLFVPGGGCVGSPERPSATRTPTPALTRVPTGLALHLLERLVAGTLERSVSIRLVSDEVGSLSARPKSPVDSGSCLACGARSGLADAARGSAG